MIASFSLGQVVATPAALAALDIANQSPAYFLERHERGDWGEFDSRVIAGNGYGMASGFRLRSSYLTGSGEKLWIITEADRSPTLL